MCWCSEVEDAFPACRCPKFLVAGIQKDLLLNSLLPKGTLSSSQGPYSFIWVQSSALAGVGYAAAEVSKDVQTTKMLVIGQDTSLRKAALG